MNRWCAWIVLVVLLPLLALSMMASPALGVSDEEVVAAIERARQAQRVYLRGRPAAVVVDVHRARLAGKRDSVVPAARSPSAATRAHPAQRLAQAAALCDLA